MNLGLIYETSSRQFRPRFRQCKMADTSIKPTQYFRILYLMSITAIINSTLSPANRRDTCISVKQLSTTADGTDVCTITCEIAVENEPSVSILLFSKKDDIKNSNNRTPKN